MIRKNKETDPPAARVAALTCRFDQFGRSPFNLSSNQGGWLGGEQLGSKVHLAGPSSSLLTRTLQTVFSCSGSSTQNFSYRSTAVRGFSILQVLLSDKPPDQEDLRVR